MTEIRIRSAHTADLDAAVLKAARSLLDDVFEGGFSDDDWDHALGGMHVLAWQGDALVGHAAVVQRRLTTRGRALRTGYVEAVGVRDDLQGRGIGAALMAEVERLVRGGYELGALCASEEAIDFYLGRGWQRWSGPNSALMPDGPEATDEEVFVLPVAPGLVPEGPLACDFRNGDVW
ncbi:GNAT family N-acetyltransferase [Streptomyces sp. ODS28]|uniref:GNAT family N-acetyltransferase n=1 Tax=Streptomyces sp. ODS28 TaxID=3136688 RepID=UPI0031EBAF2C